jgi:hypothetical protein
MATSFIVTDNGPICTFSNLRSPQTAPTTLTVPTNLTVPQVADVHYAPADPTASKNFDKKRVHPKMHTFLKKPARPLDFWTTLQLFLKNYFFLSGVRSPTGHTTEKKKYFFKKIVKTKNFLSK